MARLKVYASAQGFYESVVAAPSQKAALEAWGTHQDLFASGMAKVVTDDEDAIAAATKRPGEVLSRPAGSREAFRPVEFAAAPKPPKTAPRQKLAKPVGAKAKAPEPKPKPAPQPKPPPKPKPDRSPLTAAERALKAAQSGRSRELAALERERKALDRRERETTRRLDAELRRLEQAREKAQQAYERAGGKA